MKIYMDYLQGHHLTNFLSPCQQRPIKGLEGLVYKLLASYVKYKKGLAVREIRPYSTGK